MGESVRCHSRPWGQGLPSTPRPAVGTSPFWPALEVQDSPVRVELLFVLPGSQVTLLHQFLDALSLEGLDLLGQRLVDEPIELPRANEGAQASHERLIDLDRRAHRHDGLLAVINCQQDY